jgi:glutamyl-tRNA reductase
MDERCATSCGSLPGWIRWCWASRRFSVRSRRPIRRQQRRRTRDRLERLFQHTFAVAKQVRTDTRIGASPVSVAFAAVGLAKQIFADLPKRTALLIGAGDTMELVARHLHENGIGRLIVANRTLERAHALAASFAGYAIALDEIPAHLGEADMVIRHRQPRFYA